MDGIGALQIGRHRPPPPTSTTPSGEAKFIHLWNRHDAPVSQVNKLCLTAGRGACGRVVEAVPADLQRADAVHGIYL